MQLQQRNSCLYVQYSITFHIQKEILKDRDIHLHSLRELFKEDGRDWTGAWILNKIPSNHFPNQLDSIYSNRRWVVSQFGQEETVGGGGWHRKLSLGTIKLGK